MRPIAGPVCSICGERLLSLFAAPALADKSDILCDLCRRATPPYLKATAYGSYESGLRELIHLLKFDQVRTASAVLGRMLAEAITDLDPFLATTRDHVLVVPVPLHSNKLQQRGFNQSELIAHSALKIASGWSVAQLRPDTLERCRETQSQIGLSRHQRRENLRGAFVVAHPAEIAGREILLVDDVFTTGTTVSECARVLRRAGASKVFVATVARTLKIAAQHAEHAMKEDETVAEPRLAMAAAS